MVFEQAQCVEIIIVNSLQEIEEIRTTKIGVIYTSGSVFIRSHLYLRLIISASYMDQYSSQRIADRFPIRVILCEVEEKVEAVYRIYSQYPEFYLLLCLIPNSNV